MSEMMTLARSLNLEAIRASASSLDRIARCEASAALPQVVDDNDNDAKDKGTAIHKFLERFPVVGLEAALLEIEERWRDVCASIELAKLAPLFKLSREVALAWNFVDDTARMVDRDERGRLLIDRSCEIAVVIDVIGVGADEVFVGDYKSGHGWLPSPEQSYQLGLGALAAARYFNKRRARVEYIRIRDDGSVYRKNATLDGIALDGAADMFAAKLARARELRTLVMGGFVPNVNEGAWCKYCPAKHHCPAKTALVRHVMTETQPVQYVTPLTPEIALKALLQLRRAKEGLGAIESMLYAYAKITPILVEVEEDGTERWFGEYTREGNEEFDGALAHQVITEKYGGEAANKVVTMETTKKAITDLVKKKLAESPVEGATIKGTTEEIYEAIREKQGGPIRPPTTTTCEYTVDPAGNSKARRRKASS